MPPSQLNGSLRCAITDRTTDPEGFVSTGRVLTGWDQPVDLSIAAAKEIARLLGWVSREEVEGHLARLAEMETEIEALRARVDKLATYRELEAELAGAV
ncbi:MAG: hypothetical protein ACRDLD_02220 [Thermoleophilaceae bacterium]